MSICAILMGPVECRIKRLDERRVMVRNLLEGVGLLKLKIRQPQLNFKLGFNQILPRLALLDIQRFNG